MSLDQTLHQAFETLSGRLRAELQTAAAEIAASVHAERDRVAADARAHMSLEALEPGSEAAADLDARLRNAEARAREEGRAEGYADGFASGTEAERESGRADSPSDPGPSERMLEGIRSISAARSLSEVLDMLASGAAGEAARAGVLLVRGGRLRGWRFVGFPSRFDTADTLDIAVADAGLVADAVRGGAAVSGTSATPSFAELSDGRRALAVPIAMGGQVVAVLYADEGERTVSVGWPDRVEVLARFAARCLEAITAFKAARVLLERPGRPAGRDVAGATDDHGDAGDPTDADAAARRYARLLVSEIKLYHEPEVITGRRERDLATRLSPQISRARLLYEQRVPPLIGQRTDYFHAELVRTLADGDAGLLELRT